MAPQLLPATADESAGWQQTVMAFLAEKERRSGSKRTVEGYARMLWPFLGGFGSPAEVTPAHVLALALGRGLSSRSRGRDRSGILRRLLVPLPVPPSAWIRLHFPDAGGHAARSGWPTL